jgi:hypothetical protein
MDEVKVKEEKKDKSEKRDTGYAARKAESEIVIPIKENADEKLEKKYDIPAIQRWMKKKGKATHIVPGVGRIKLEV